MSRLTGPKAMLIAEAMKEELDRAAGGVPQCYVLITFSTKQPSETFLLKNVRPGVALTALRHQCAVLQQELERLERESMR